VFEQTESYDPKTHTRQQHAPMLTPRHAVGATVLGDRSMLRAAAPYSAAHCNPPSTRLRAGLRIHQTLAKLLR
jgi:hypothetical protein